MSKLSNPFKTGAIRITQEVWKPVKGYEGLYEISNFGNVKTSYNKGKGDFLKPRYQRQGYVLYVLYKDGEGVAHTAHRLVAQAFLENPQNKKTVNHKNGVKNDNRVDNIEWATQLENNSHARERGWYPVIRGEKAGSSKLTNKEARRIKMALKLAARPKDLAEQFGVGVTTIRAIKCGQNWSFLNLNEI